MIYLCSMIDNLIFDRFHVVPITLHSIMMMLIEVSMPPLNGGKSDFKGVWGMCIIMQKMK